MQITHLLKAALHDLDTLKAINILPLDVRGITTITDHMIIATGSSSRHVQAIANHLLEKMKERHFEPLGCESDDGNEWVLVDLGDVVVHIMQQRTRDFYQLEKLWTPCELQIASA